jgi:hypothetical protein
VKKVSDKRNRSSRLAMASEPLLPLRQVGRKLMGKTSIKLKELKRSLYRLSPDPGKEAEPQCSSIERVMLRSPPRMRLGRARIPLRASWSKRVVDLDKDHIHLKEPTPGLKQNIYPYTKCLHRLRRG